MKNLQIVHYREHNWSSISPIEKACLTFGEDNEFFLCSNLKIYHFSENKMLSVCDIQNEIQRKDALIINLSYLTVPQQLCVILDSGEIFSLSKDFTVINLQGISSSDLLAAKFSPDEELLVVVANVNTLIIMNSLYDIIIEVDLLEKSFGEGEFINVGWGKKETQFHGSEGKSAAKAKVELDTAVLTTYSNDHKVSITWRGDGELFAVGFTSENHIVTFKTFNREGILQYTSEKQPGLENNFCWRPSGNLLATTQIFPNKYVVAFFEKNGLKHGEFVLPFLSEECTVIGLGWSGDSEVLSVHCLSLDTGTTTLLIYSVNNYHWYLKQTVSFLANSQIKELIWDNGIKLSNGKKLFLLTSLGCCHVYNWAWAVNHSRGYTENDRAIVGVIDGKKVLLTDFKRNIIPPPMSSLTLLEDKYVSGIIFGPSENVTEVHSEIDSNSICIFLYDKSLIFYSVKSCKTFQYDRIGKLSLENINSLDTKNTNLWMWIKSDLLLSVQIAPKGCSIAHIIKVVFPQKDDVKQDIVHEILNSIEINNIVISVQNILRSHQVLLQCEDGILLKLNPADNTVVSVKHSTEQQYIKCEGVWMDDNVVVFGLTERNKFYLDEIEVADNVTSFFVHSDFLLLTTLQHSLLCSELSMEGLAGLKCYKNGEKCNVFRRKIERGAKLVIVVPKDTRAVLQMPRGNLETIQPRSLSLKLIGSFLDSHKYYEAFDIMRKQRINLNLIYDHNPCELIKNIDTFINQINNNSWLSLFLSELEENDVTETMYFSSYCNIRKNTISNNTDGSKIVKVCASLREAIESHCNLKDKIIPLLTSYIKINTIEGLEKALVVIKQLRESEHSGNYDGGIKANEALKYLQYLVHIDKLYDTALGMYDFELVLFIANNSQKDPKEYVPFLNEINVMEENYKRYTIDKHLKRYVSALKYLYRCFPEREAELLSFVKQHGLHKDALRLLNKHEHIYIDLANEYGHLLTVKKLFSEAAFVYMSSNNYRKVAECCKESLEWETAIIFAKKVWNESSEEMKTFYQDLLKTLHENKRYTAALQIMELFIKDIKKAITYAAEVGKFRTAMRLCLYEEATECFEIIKPAVMEKMEDLITQIKQSQEQFVQQKKRLNVVRKQKASTEGNNDPIRMNDSGESDLYSDTSSVITSTATRTSSRSFRSSKNRRKHERKLVSLKEGSPYEDLALIRSLYNLVTMSFKMRAEMSETCYALHYFEEHQNASNAQDYLDKLLETMTLSFNEIWTNDLATPSQTMVGQGLDLDVDSLEPYLRIPPLIEDYKWKLYNFTQ